MIKPSWDIFKTKFCENRQGNFEWLCYLLFCEEFNKPLGIFRYKNQSAIETNPIEHDNELIGWQAKFYDSSLSDHKEKILETIRKSKRDYPLLNKLLFYTNQEWGQSRGQTPAGLIEIETCAKDLSIVLDWRVSSYFESPFVCIDNQIIAQYFFSLERGIVDTIEEQQRHTSSILNQIRTCINFNDFGIEIDRGNNLEVISHDTKQAFIVSGAGGVGKTVLIKKLYEKEKGEYPFYIFKASEFELKNINDLFKDCSCYSFFDAHKTQQNKTIVIDSAEKLLDLNNTDPFKEFLNTILAEKWKVIFTTRNNYLEDLNYQLFEIHGVIPSHLNIKILEPEELQTLADNYSFTLPMDNKLVELIKNPFYLSEYLKYYESKDKTNYKDFKLKLWDRNIKKSKPEREVCFLEIALARANSGQFFINKAIDTIKSALVNDGILGYETAGFFITHDIYEEWALEKIIQAEFIKRTTALGFFNAIGESLAIRRSFRHWLSEKIQFEMNDVKAFIEETVNSSQIKSFWRDELFVSVLLSNYSSVFFQTFKSDLLSNNCEFLKKITFVLRVACKEVDDEFFKKIGVKNSNFLSLKHVFTKPKGKGWESLIKFIFENIVSIGLKNINFFSPAIYDWNNKNKEGETTRFSSLIALEFYKLSLRENLYYSRGDEAKQVLQTIVYGSSEIQGELKEIFDDVVSNQWKWSKTPYYDLSKLILTELDGVHFCKALPEYAIKLADLFWSYTPREDKRHYRSSIEIEHHFGLESNHQDYHPASAYQTPIYWLLKSDLQKTIDFILSFTNKSIKTYALSGFDKSVQSIDVHIDDSTTQKQYISHCLWCLYRGTGSPVSPYLLQSMHMALEKILLEIGEHYDSRVLESWLLYLLTKSESASISAIVASIVLAYPDKTFNIAKILFHTKEFVCLDTSRLVAEYGAKSLYSIGKNWGRSGTAFYDDERIKTCDDKHRTSTLENQFLNYQIFRNDKIDEIEIEKRQKDLWQILDGYYAQLPPESEQDGNDKTWRLYLARMDRRKMGITTHQVDDGIVIQFNPKIEVDLEEYREATLDKNSEYTKYVPLRSWSDYKFNQDDKCKQYEHYESNPLNALKEAREIVNELNKSLSPVAVKTEYSHDESVSIFNRSIPAYVCSVLMRDYEAKLSVEDKTYCKDLILHVASLACQPDYRYQISDGVQPAISVLPILFGLFPDDRGHIKSILLLSMFNDCSTGWLASEGFSILPITVTHNLWENYFDDAQSLLFGYLSLKPQQDKLRTAIRENCYQDGSDVPYGEQLLKEFLSENEETLQAFIENTLVFDPVKSIAQLDLDILKNAFLLIPLNTNDSVQKEIAKAIIWIFAKTLLSAQETDKVEYDVKHDFLKRYSQFLLSLDKDEIETHLKPFLDDFDTSECMSELLTSLIIAEDNLHSKENFWFIWGLFKDKVVQTSQVGKPDRYADKLIMSYLFAQTSWKETTTKWDTLSDDSRMFFKDISDAIGHYPSVLYSISKLLNNIGSTFLDDGVFWISSILNRNENYVNQKLETNTIYYIENVMKKFIFSNREKIKMTKSLKDSVLITLSFLVENGSVVGYMLRENIM